MAPACAHRTQADAHAMHLHERACRSAPSSPPVHRQVGRRWGKRAEGFLQRTGQHRMDRRATPHPQSRVARQLHRGASPMTPPRFDPHAIAQPPPSPHSPTYALSIFSYQLFAASSCESCFAPSPFPPSTPSSVHPPSSVRCGERVEEDLPQTSVSSSSLCPPPHFPFNVRAFSLRRHVIHNTSPVRLRRTWGGGGKGGVPFLLERMLVIVCVCAPRV